MTGFSAELGGPRRCWRSVVCLCGGAHGASFLEGLASQLPPEVLTAIVNTGDDFTHWGLHISPDLDAVMYALAGLSRLEPGWGLAEESFTTLGMVGQYGGAAWFRVGDRDLATHLLRTAALRKRETLTDITKHLCLALGVEHSILPMADLPRATYVDTVEHETLQSKEWQLRPGAQSTPTNVSFKGESAPGPKVIEALLDAELVVIAPSNPFLSIDPILALDGVRAALGTRPVLAVSPITAGRSPGSPTASMIWQLQHREPSAGAVAAHYGRFLTGMVVDEGEAAALPQDLPFFATSVETKEPLGRQRLARDVLDFGAALVRPTLANTWALVPVRAFASAQTRLGRLMSHERRVQFAKKMFDHVLDVLLAMGLGGVAIVTDSPSLADHVRDRGAKALLDPPDADLAKAVDVGLATLARHGATAAVVLMADLPRLATSDVSQLVDLLAQNPVVLAPDRDGGSTNALAVSPPDLMPTSFGFPDSLARHQASARRHHAPPLVCRMPNLALDVDSAADILELLGEV